MIKRAPLLSRYPHIYHVNYADCTDYEPQPGWYLAVTADNPDGVKISGPYSRDVAMEKLRGFGGASE